MSSCRVLLALAGLVAATHGLLTPQQMAVFTGRGVNITETADGKYVIGSDGLPDHAHGQFPSEHNPNEVAEQEHWFEIPKTTDKADPPGCLPMGSIGFAINGVVLFNPYTAEGYNAVEGEYKETFDDCDGHPQMTGVYHYHQIPSCLYTGTANELLGIAFDGYLIYGPLDENGRNLTTADLDFCHGRVVDGVYRYHMTYDFPYILSCYYGTAPVRAGPPNGGGNGPPPQGGGDRPPPRDEDDGMGPPPGGRTPSDHDGCYANYSQPQPREDGGDGPTGGSILLFMSHCLLLSCVAALFFT